jgi:putative tryptophan/tyrosine transport system substrate-binding protein
MAARRHVLIYVAAAVLGMRSSVSRAQARIARIGFLAGDNPTSNVHRIDAFREGLRELGYVEGSNAVIEFRWADGNYDRLPDLAAQLVAIPVDVIVAVGDPVILAATRATKTIPIVMASVGDPIGRGFVATLGRPGGNVTGVSNFAAPMMGKWIELLKEIMPGMSQVAILGNAENPTHLLFRKEAQNVAARMGVRLQEVEIRDPGDLDKAFESIVAARSQAVIVLPDPVLAGREGRRVAALAAKHQMAAMCTFREQVQAGALIAYGPDLTANYRRSAYYVDRILKGAKPGDLPVEQPTKFVSVVNLKTAAALKLTIPPAVLLRVDEVIQ